MFPKDLDGPCTCFWRSACIGGELGGEARCMYVRTHCMAEKQRAVLLQDCSSALYMRRELFSTACMYIHAHYAYMHAHTDYCGIDSFIS